MALTIEKLKADATIGGANLPDSVLAQIATLSENDENIIINQKVGATYQLVDNVVQELTGVAKPNGMKTTDFVKTHLSTLKEKAEAAGNIGEITKERDELKTKATGLEEQIRKGNTDEALKAQLKAVNDKLSQKEADLEALKTAKEKEIQSLKTSLDKETTTNLELAYQREADSYFAKLTFDPKLPSWAIEAKKAEVLAKVKSEKGRPGFDENRNLVFKDENGATLNNPSNGLKPFSFEDLAGEYVKEAVVDGASVGGGGTKPPSVGGTGSGGSFSIAGLTSKTQVVNAIKQKLSDDGVAITDPDYQSKFDGMYSTEGVEDLPLRD